MLSQLSQLLVVVVVVSFRFVSTESRPEEGKKKKKFVLENENTGEKRLNPVSFWTVPPAETLST